MTDNRPEDSAPGDSAAEAPARHEPPTADPLAELPEATLRLADLDPAPDASPTDDPDATDASDTDEPAEAGRSRPPLAVIIGSVLLLVVIGAGLAFLIPSGPIREVDQLIPTVDPAAVPTALPLPEVVEGDAAEVIAEVGAGRILRGDFARFYQPGASPDELLDQLIQRELVVQQGLKEGATVDDAVVAEQLNQIKQQQAGGDPAQFEAFLAQTKIGSEENLTRLLGHDQIIEQMILKYTTAEQVHARHILLSTENISDTATIKTEAEALLKQLEDGGDFAALAGERSDDPGSAANGGDLGWALRGMYVPEFDAAVFAMQPGERRLVETQFGFHIIEVVEPVAVRGIDSSMLQTPAGQQAFAESFIPWVEQLQQAAETAQEIRILVPAAQLVTAPTQ